MDFELHHFLSLSFDGEAAFLMNLKDYGTDQRVHRLLYTGGQRWDSSKADRSSIGIHKTPEGAYRIMYQFVPYSVLFLVRNIVPVTVNTRSGAIPSFPRQTRMLSASGRSKFGILNTSLVM